MRVLEVLVVLIVHVNGLQKRNLVYPRLLEERSAEGTMVIQVHDGMMLNLKKASVAGADNASERPVVSERQNPWFVQVPETVTIEVFIISDSAHHKHFSSTQTLLVYFCVMVNSANIRFSAAVFPKIVLLLVGVEKSLTDEFLAVYAQNPRYVYDYTTLEKFENIC
ncbi:hypothetical protein MTO96_002462 [Rhipicephalus appendiculatus]